MRSSDVSGETTAQVESALGVDMSLEVVTLPVADVDRSKAFYQVWAGGWTSTWLSATRSGPCSSRRPTPGARSSSARAGLAAEPGSSEAMILVVKDIDAARDDLINRGVDVSGVQEMKPPGFDAPGRSYFARASFSDPDGNGWELQEITSRLPGRTWEN